MDTSNVENMELDGKGLKAEDRIKKLKLQYKAGHISDFVFNIRAGEIYLRHATRESDRDMQDKENKLIRSMKEQLEPIDFKRWKIGYQCDNFNGCGVVKTGLPALNQYVILSTREKYEGKFVYRLRLAKLVMHNNIYGNWVPVFRLYNAAEDEVTYRYISYLSPETGRWENMFGAWRPISALERKRMEKLGLESGKFKKGVDGKELEDWDMKGATLQLGKILDSDLKLSSLTLIRLPLEEDKIVANIPGIPCSLHGKYVGESGRLYYSNNINDKSGNQGYVKFLELMIHGKVSYREYKEHDYSKFGILNKVFRGKDGKVISYSICYGDGVADYECSLSVVDAKDMLVFGQKIQGLHLGYNGTRVVIEK